MAREKRITPGQLLKKLARIERQFEKAEEIFLSIPEQVRERMNRVHYYEGTIPYCYSYGMQACDELAKENMKKMTKEE